MWTLHTANAEHWVPIKQVSSFKRMREYQPLGLEWITNALRLSEELEVSEDGTQVRRRTEVQEPKGQFERSVYAVRLPSCDAVCVLNSAPERLRGGDGGNPKTAGGFLQPVWKDQCGAHAADRHDEGIQGACTCAMS